MEFEYPQNLLVDNFPANNRSLRIAVVSETYPPEVNGVAVTLSKVVEGLRNANHALQLVRLRQNGTDAAAQDDMYAGYQEVLMRGFPIPNYPDLRMGIPSKSSLIRLWQLKRPDVVHIATEGPLGWSALRAAMYLKLPVSTDYRTNFQSYSTHYGVGFLYKPIMAYLKKFHNHAGCTMVPTEALRASLAAVGFQRLKVVSRGVDTVAYDPAHRSDALRQQWGLAPQDLAVLCVGRLAKEKNLDLLLRAFEAIQARQPSARLVLVGHGPMLQELQLKCPRAIFTGQLRGHTLAEHYASADLFLMPSLTETFGNVTTEAMASGLPVVAFHYAAAAEMIVSGVNGRLAAMRDAEDFVFAASEVAAQPVQLKSMAAAARQTALGLDWACIVEKFENELQEVIDASRLITHSGTPPRSTPLNASRV
ncbi:MAG: glycosyltransferase family 1 protein [Rhodoferax sp.]|nr:glycosyltransferase family 1 protein [Rhodoferax sp.]